MSLISMTLLTLLTGLQPAAPATKYFQIQVVDEQTGRGVPLVELRTVHAQRYYTDSNGIVAFHEPGLMTQRIFFFVQSHGYEFAKDGFGFPGRALDVKKGGKAKLKIKRLNIAERLYRITGAGIYRDSVLTGIKPPLKHPLLNGQVFGSDSVVNAIYRGKLYWFWGDTNRPSYPLGNFQVPGAVSDLPGKGGLDPKVGVNLDYFVDAKGFAKQMAPIPGPGPTWIGALAVAKDKTGKERMFAFYMKVRKQLEVYARGLAVYDNQKRLFNKVVSFDLKAPIQPGGHTFVHKDDGVEYIYFANPFPLLRVRATAEDMPNLAKYQAYTCLKEGSRLNKPLIDRDKNGMARYSWKNNTPLVGQQEQVRLIRAGQLKRTETLLHMQDIDSGKPISVNSGSVFWNTFRKRWVMITVQNYGSSMLGEIWYSEADTPVGPWVYAKKIITHDRYSFYNPKHHPMFDQDKGRFIFLEGTYTHTFSGNSDQTPLYDYNQIMYRLDLDDARLNLPVPIYLPREVVAKIGPAHLFKSLPSLQTIGFFALDRMRKGCIPIYQRQIAKGIDALDLSTGSKEQADQRPLFFALPPSMRNPPAATTLLYEYVHKNAKKRLYDTDANLTLREYQRNKNPLCRVWKNPRK